MESYQGRKTFTLIFKCNGYVGWWKENTLPSVSHPKALVPHLRVMQKMYQDHHVALLPGVPLLLEHSKGVQTPLPRPPSLFKWFLKSEDPFKSISGTPTSPSERDVLIPDQNNLLWLHVSKTTSQEMRSGFRSVPSLDIINKIKFCYIRRTIKINWKGQLKEVPKLVWGNTMKTS